jgi:hypothetical protein
MVAGALVMSHRQIPVIVRLSAITSCARPLNDSPAACFIGRCRGLIDRFGRWSNDRQPT